MTWDVFRRGGSVSELHQLDLIDGRRSVWRLEANAPAVALGSTQPDDVLEGRVLRDLGLEVARRRSGGGLVIIDPSASAWVDVVIGTSDRLWSADVGRAFAWVGEAWARAALITGVIDSADEVSVHSGAPLWDAEGRIVCFAGIGAGEVHIGGRKLVGMSQRRTRLGARFQCLVHREFRADWSFDVVAADHRSVLLGERLRACVVEVNDLETLVGAFVDQLQTLPD